MNNYKMVVFVVFMMMGLTLGVNITKAAQDTCEKYPDGSFMKKYKMMGKMFDETRYIVNQGIKEDIFKTEEEKTLKLPTVKKWEQQMQDDKAKAAETHKDFLKSCHMEYIDIPTTDNQTFQTYMIRSNKAPKSGKIAVVDIIGGAGLYGLAWFNQIDQCNETHRLGEDVVIFVPQYRRPPEHKTPASFEDVHNLVKHLYNNPKKYGIDRTKIGVYGVSGGGYVLSGTGMVMAEHNDTHMAKSFYTINPMLDDTTWTTAKDQLNELEIIKIPMNKGTFNIHSEGLNQDQQKYLYPSKMPLSLLQKFPKTIVASAEYDQFRLEATKFAKRLGEAGRLETFVVYPGSVHSFMGLDREKHPIWLDVVKNFKKWVDCYLRP